MLDGIRQIADAVSSGRRSARDVCADHLSRIRQLNARYSAFLQVVDNDALAAADRVDDAVRRGQPPGPLAGVPLALKDNICTRIGRTTCGSRILERYVSPYDATVVERLTAAGAVIIGKTNLDEFAMGSSTENSGFHPTRNPWNTAHVPGGSSGGSAAAVAAALVPAALGSDTGGSVRQPAALCGVVGLKPTYGRVSRYGLVAYGSSLDQIGPLTRTVTDAAIVLGAIAGPDPRDATSLPAPVPDYAAALADAPLAERAAGLRIGVPRECLGDGLDAEVRRAFEEALAVYRRIGARVVDVSLPRTPYSIAAYYVLATAEASSNLARYDGVRDGHRAAGAQGLVDLYCRSRSEGFGAEVKRRIMLGTFALSAGYHDAFYDKARRARALIGRDFEQAWAHCDVLATPTAPTPAFRLGEKLSDPLAMYLADVFTVPANLAGLPAISVPCGFSTGGLPIGLQLTGPALGETLLLQAARLYERETDWHTRRPPV